ncbi:uncharacterized protein A4U43_C09F3980 [Asparagus officinalis]|uniref:Uncharacterized protein n=1 Tax=Asparagus officinalis TaxID=4686 RepID=A0A5P1E8H7_ASPOF|nr:uncharacterized protein A4U43_C09F3980 [Asparagus officinalis]
MRKSLVGRRRTRTRAGGRRWLGERWAKKLKELSAVITRPFEAHQRVRVRGPAAPVPLLGFGSVAISGRSRKMEDAFGINAGQRKDVPPNDGGAGTDGVPRKDGHEGDEVGGEAVLCPHGPHGRAGAVDVRVRAVPWPDQVLLRSLPAHLPSLGVHRRDRRRRAPSVDGCQLWGF